MRGKVLSLNARLINRGGSGKKKRRWDLRKISEGSRKIINNVFPNEILARSARRSIAASNAMDAAKHRHINAVAANAIRRNALAYSTCHVVL